jgi:hypothetical protein
MVNGEGTHAGEQTVIELIGDELVVSFPTIHEDAVCRIGFQRTLRIPDDNREYPLPAGLGQFPLHHVDDFASTVPSTWLEHGGVLMPMYQAEAMWIHFGGGRWDEGYPFAIKIAAGKINAVSGGEWLPGLSGSPQNYVVTPGQPWLDGFSVQRGLIRQFVAMPLGEGFTAEEQITGKSEHGGLQIQILPMRRERYEELLKARRREMVEFRTACYSMAEQPCLEMGLAPGGLMRQEIYADEYGIDAWDTTVSSRCFIHIVNSTMYREITGCRPPTAPVTADEYRRAGIPWFDYYAADAKALAGVPALAQLDSVAAKTIKKGRRVQEPRVTIDEQSVVKLSARSGNGIREGRF